MKITDIVSIGNRRIKITFVDANNIEGTTTALWDDVSMSDWAWWDCEHPHISDSDIMTWYRKRDQSMCRIDRIRKAPYGDYLLLECTVGSEKRDTRIDYRHDLKRWESVQGFVSLEALNEFMKSHEHLIPPPPAPQRVQPFDVPITEEPVLATEQPRRARRQRRTTPRSKAAPAVAVVIEEPRPSFLRRLCSYLMGI